MDYSLLGLHKAHCKGIVHVIFNESQQDPLNLWYVYIINGGQIDMVIPGHSFVKNFTGCPKKIQILSVDCVIITYTGCPIKHKKEVRTSK